MDKNSKIFVTGHSGLVGSAMLKELKSQGFENLVTKPHAELDLLVQKDVQDFFQEEKPEYVIHLAAKVGGINGNKSFPAEYIYENSVINTNVIHSAHLVGVKKLLNFGSVCIYPVHAEVPIKEESLLTGPLEVTNEGYALAKISSLMMCKKYFEQYGDKFISVMPANIYGPNDNFHVTRAHVVPMLMRRIHEAKTQGIEKVTVWGSGNQTRDFIFSEDAAAGMLHIMQNYQENQHLNLSNGEEVSIRTLAEMLVSVVGYEGELFFDTSRPDGTPKRYMDTTRLNSTGWTPKVTLEEGLKRTYSWFLENKDYVDKKFPKEGIF